MQKQKRQKKELELGTGTGTAPGSSVTGSSGPSSGSSVTGSSGSSGPSSGSSGTGTGVEAAAVGEWRRLRIALVCASNMNRSMEAHRHLLKKGLLVASYGTSSSTYPYKYK